jgi:hypothetical protein
MMRTALFSGWLFCSLSLLAAAAVADDSQTADAGAKKYALRYKFQLGQSLRWEVIHQAKIKTTVSGTTQTAETTSVSVKLWRVKDVRPDGTATFEHMVESVDMGQKLTGRQEVRYNSKTDAKAPLGFENVAESVGKILSVVTMDARGNVLHRQRTPVKASSENDGPMTILLPEEPVAIGESWAFPTDVEVPLQNGMIKKVKTEQKLTLKSVSAGVATIEVVTHILTPIHDPMIEAMLIQRESSGTVRFDLDAGRVLGQQMDLDKKVVGFRGDASSLHYLTRFTEELLPEETKTAKR